MDEKELGKQRARLDKLTVEISNLTTKEKTTRARLDDERDRSHKAEVQRATLLDKLIGATEQETAKLHSDIDSLDKQITSGTRLAEGFERALAATKHELETVGAERAKLNEVVAQEETARAFAAWRAGMETNFAAAREALATARVALGRLTVEAAAGVERFKGAASNWAAVEFDRFDHEEHNPESLGGFTMALPWYRNVMIPVTPMVRG